MVSKTVTNRKKAKEVRDTKGRASVMLSYLEVSDEAKQNVPLWFLRHAVLLTIVTLMTPLLIALIVISLPLLAVKKIIHDLNYTTKKKAETPANWKNGPYWRNGMNYHYFRWCPVHFEVFLFIL
jgi:hypothetical protein